MQCMICARYAPSLCTTFGKLCSSTAAVDPFRALLKVLLTPLCHDSIGWLFEMLSGVSRCKPMLQQLQGGTKYSFHSVRSFGLAASFGSISLPAH